MILQKPLMERIDISGLSDLQIKLLGRISLNDLVIASEAGMTFHKVRYQINKLCKHYSMTRKELSIHASSAVFQGIESDLRAAQSVLLSVHLPHEDSEDCSVCQGLVFIKKAIGKVT